MSLVSIIIVNFNAGQGLVSCVSSIIDATDGGEIIVVDNNSADTSMDDLVAAYGSEKRLKIIRNNANLGFSKACNMGTRAASGDFLLYLNPDCLIEKQTIPELKAVFEQHPDAGMAGGRLLNPDGSEQAGSRRDIPTPWRSFVHLSGLVYFSKLFPGVFSGFLRHRESVPEAEIEVEAVSGACMMVPRKIIDDVGGFDEAYFLHVEDLDWCLRIRQKEWKIFFAPRARVTHAKGVCSARRPVFVEWHKHLGLTRFFWKFFRHQGFGLVLPVAVAGIWSHFLLVAVFRFVKRGLPIDGPSTP